MTKPNSIHSGSGRRRHASRSAGLVRLLCIFALVLAAFAHRAPVEDIAERIELSAYVLPDGSLPVFCLSDGNAGENGNHSQSYVSCEFCRIAGSVALASPPQLLSPRYLWQRISNPHFPVVVRFAATVFPPGTPPHGPPSFQKPV